MNKVDDCLSKTDCYGVYLDSSGNDPICMQIMGCPSDSQQPFYLAPLLKSSLHNPNAQKSVWVKLPGTNADKLQLPFTDEYNLHPMSSYALTCKYKSLVVKF